MRAAHARPPTVLTPSRCRPPQRQPHHWQPRLGHIAAPPPILRERAAASPCLHRTFASRLVEGAEGVPVRRPVGGTPATSTARGADASTAAGCGTRRPPLAPAHAAPRGARLPPVPPPHCRASRPRLAAYAGAPTDSRTEPTPPDEGPIVTHKFHLRSRPRPRAPPPAPARSRHYTLHPHLLPAHYHHLPSLPLSTTLFPSRPSPPAYPSPPPPSPPYVPHDHDHDRRVFRARGTPAHRRRPATVGGGEEAPVPDGGGGADGGAPNHAATNGHRR